MSFSRKVKIKIKRYQPKGSLDKTALFFLSLCGINHPLAREHVERVALLAEIVALRLKKDAKAAFFAGIFHDVGKVAFAHHLFNGRNITNEEYEEIKKHALAGFKILKQSRYLFTASVVGLHHAMYERGYGLSAKDFPRKWSTRTIKKVLEVSTIVAICDDIDATLHRKTILKGVIESGLSLQDRLKRKFPDDHMIVTIALEEVRKMK